MIDDTMTARARPARVPEGFGAVCRGGRTGRGGAGARAGAAAEAGAASRARSQQDDEPPKKKPLLDKDGREYRVCDMCGGNMYKQENTWTCEQCGFSYEE